MRLTKPKEAEVDPIITIVDKPPTPQSSVDAAGSPAF
jgi:hypothetical protein